MEKLTEELISRKEIYRCGIMSLKVDRVKLPNGKESTRTIINHPGAVCVASITDNKEIAFVRQYRHALSKVIIELPAGKLEPGEDPLEACKRELTEETGISGKNFSSLGCIYVSPGYTNEIIHLYTCKANSIGEISLDEDEFLEPVFIELDKAIDMVINGEIKDSKTQLCLLKLEKYLSKSSF